MSTAPLYRQQSVVLDGSGNGTIQIDIPAVENWSINAVTVNATPNTLEAQCRIYRGQHGSRFLVDSTISGSSGDTSDTIHDMLGGESLYVEWQSGTVGATASVTIRGTITNPQQVGGFRAVS